MSRSVFPLFFLSILFMLSCSDDSSTNEPETVNFESLVNLDIGNYWIYQLRTEDASGQINSHQLDTLRVLRDTMVGSQRMFIMNREYAFSASNIVYDSLNYLKAFPSRHVIFTSDPSFEDSFENEVSTASTRFVESPVEVEVPGGAFDCFNYKLTFTSKDPDYPHGEICGNHYFSDGIGLVKYDAQYYSSGRGIEYVLVKYGD